MPVVYNGVPGSGQGDLFQGLKMWISQRVPMREKCVDLVKGNGGTVVQLEKNADMIIADHIKRGGVSPPPGSYSWKWIEFSVKNGVLQDKDDYQIGRPEGSSRAVGSTEQTKVGRTAFTQKDDLLLTKWILSKERKGEATNGNDIFKELERRQPHHTWQSWRDRWVKRLRDRQRPSFPEAELEQEIDAISPPAAPSPPPATAAVNASLTRLAGTPEPEVDRRDDVEPTFSPPRRSPRISKKAPGEPSTRGRNFFTADEDRLLLEYVQEAKLHGEKLSGNLIYQQFAAKYPSHSWHSWRDRWLRHLKKEDEDDRDMRSGDAAEKERADDHQGPRVHPWVTESASKSANLGASKYLADSEVVEVPGTAGAGILPPKRPDPRSDEERLKRQERIKREMRAAKLLQRTWRGHALRRTQSQLEAAVVPLQSMMRGFLLRVREAQRLAEARAAAKQVDGNDDAGTALMDSTPHDSLGRTQFFNDLQDYIEASGVDIQPAPAINGRTIDLWHLFYAATQQDCPAEERDWRQVAEDLGFAHEESLDVAQQIRNYFDANLATFEEAIRDFDEEGDDPEDFADEALEELDHDEATDALPTSDAVTAPKKPIVHPPSPAYQSSPPLAALKRSRQHSDLLSSDLTYPTSGSRKRRRLDKDSVIPPTPEHRSGRSGDQTQRGRTQDKSSPLKSRGIANGDAIMVASDEESDGYLDEDMDLGDLPDRSQASKKQGGKPGNQNWLNDAESGQSADRLMEDDDISPSQQLQLESDAYNSPERVLFKGQVRHAPQPVHKSAQIVGSGASENTNRAVPRTIPQATDAPVVTKVTKRMLPPHYRKSAPTAARTAPTASAQNPTSVGQARSQAQQSAPRLTPSGAALQRKANSNGPQAGPFTSFTPSLLHPSSRKPVTVSTPAKPLTYKDYASQVPHNNRYLDSVIDAAVDHFMALGYKQKDIMTALDAGTCQRGPMTVALDSLSKRKGIPQDQPGVWTSQDIEELKMIRSWDRRMKKGKDSVETPLDSRTRVRIWNARNRLAEKHGEEGVKNRNLFADIMEG